MYCNITHARLDMSSYVQYALTRFAHDFCLIFGRENERLQLMLLSANKVNV